MGEVVDSFVTTVVGDGLWWSWVVLSIHIDDMFDIRGASTHSDGPRRDVLPPDHVGGSYGPVSLLSIKIVS